MTVAREWLGGTQLQKFSLNTICIYCSCYVVVTIYTDNVEHRLNIEQRDWLAEALSMKIKLSTGDLILSPPGCATHLGKSLIVLDKHFVSSLKL